MTWLCPTCRTSYARRKDHDESASNRGCLEREYRVAVSEHQSALALRNMPEELSIALMDKEVNRAFAKMKIAERKLR